MITLNLYDDQAELLYRLLLRTYQRREVFIRDVSEEYMIDEIHDELLSCMGDNE